MTNRRTTKQLFVSVVLLIVCILMLLGTTFAWFTDNATSPDNKVEAGTLDVQLCMYNGTEYENIGDSAKPIFGKADSLVAQNDAQDTLWEPGKTQVVYLKIVNNGSLDLKYKVSIDVKDNADDKDLYKALEYAIDVGVDSTMAAPLWDGGKKVIPGNNVDTTDVKLPAKEEGSTAHEHYFTLSVHMLEEAGNVYQGGYVEFDIKVAATQLNSEEGSFGSDYDIDATYPEVDTLVIPETGTSPVDIVDYDEVADQVDTKITLPAGSAAGTYTLAVSNENVVTDAEGNTVSSFDIELTVNGEKVPAGTYVVEKYVGEYLNDVKVTHKGEPVAVDAYDPTTGYVTFTVDSFSPFAVSYYSGVINTVEDLANIAKGGNFILMSDIEIAEAVVVPEGKSVVFDLNGKNITSAMTSGRTIVVNGVLNLKNGSIVTNDGVCGVYATGKSASLTLTDMTIDVNGTGSNAEWNHAAIGAANGATVVINNGTYSAEVGYGLTVMTSGAHITINDGTFTTEGATNSAAVRLDSGWDNSKIYTFAAINGGTFNAPEGGYAFTATNAYGKDIVIYDGIFNGKLASHYQEKGVVINGGTFNKTIVEGGGHTDKYLINGGTFVEDVTKYLATGYTAVANNDGTWTVITKTEGIDLAVVANYPHLFTDGTNYYVYDAQGLIAMRDYWQANQYANKMWGCSYNIMADIDATGYTWNSVYVVVGHNGNDGFIIDGHDHTISGLTIKDSMFTGTPNGGDAGTKPGEVKNITFDNVKVTGDHWTAVVWGNTYGEIVFDDVHVVNSTISGKCNTAAFVGGTAQESGDVTITFNNCSVENTSISANGAFSGVKGDWASDPNGANVFISRAFNKAYIVFEGENVSESNTVTNTNGVIGGGIYGYTAFADGWWAGFGACDKFENWNGLVVTSNLAGGVNGENVVLSGNVNTEASTTAPYGNKYAVKMDGGVLDGNGNELYMECYGDDYGIMTSGGTIKNLTITEGCRAVMIMYAKEDIILDNVNIGGDGVLYPINTGEYAVAEGVDLVVTNSTLAGWVSYAGIESASFTNVKFEQGTYYNNIYGRVLKPYVNTTLTKCSFVEHMNLDLSGLVEGQKITIDNCTVNGTAVTADVFTVPTSNAQYDTELFTVDLPSWANSINDCIVFK